MAVGKTYTPQGGPQITVQQQAGKPYTSTVRGAPPTQPAQPLADATATLGAAPIMPQAPVPSFSGPMSPGSEERTPDMERLNMYRQALIDQLFSYDQSVAPMYSDPNSPNYIADPMKRAQVAQIPVQADTQLLSTLNKILNTQTTKVKMSPEEQRQMYRQQLNEALINDAGTTSLGDVVTQYRAFIPVNDIVDAYQTMNPDKQVDLDEALSFGYKAPTGTMQAKEEYGRAVQAEKLIDRIEQEAKAANVFYANIYRIPGILQLMGDTDPVANYEKQRKKYGQDLAKYLYKSTVGRGAASIMESIPSPWASKNIIDDNLSELRAQVADLKEAAQSKVQQFALGSQSSTMATAPISEPVATVSPPASPGIRTSTGKTFSINPSGL